MVEQDSMNITEDEAALYDRQIRLWGLDAQKRLRAAQVLLIGMGGLGAEVAKNIVLSGIKSLTLLDHLVVTEEDACCQFLIDRADLGKNRADSSLKRTQQLNPMVEITTDIDPITEKDESYIQKFDVVCATCCSLDELSRLDKICHQNKILFFAGDVFGYYGIMFSDLGEHHYAEEVADRKKPPPPADGEPAAKKTKVEEETKTVKKIENYTRLQDALDLDWSSDDYVKRLKRTPNTYFISRVLYAFREKFKRDPCTKSLSADKEELMDLRDSVTSSLKVNPDLVPQDFNQFCFAELSPVCAVTGGILGQEIIKAVSQKDGPHNNFFFYNGVDGSGMVDKLA